MSGPENMDTLKGARAALETSMTSFARNYFFSGAPAVKQVYGDDQANACIELRKIPKIFKKKINALSKHIATIKKVRNAGLEEADKEDE